jgi:hypothetical protein
LPDEKSQRTLRSRYTAGGLKPEGAAKSKNRLRQSLEDLLYRKLVGKYIEPNPYF